MPQAQWKGTIIAKARPDEVRTVEGNIYFPADAVHREFLKQSDAHTTCPWKGVASYYDVHVEGQVNPQAAWYYPEPKSAASEIKGYVAFWKGVQVTP